MIGWINQNHIPNGPVYDVSSANTVDSADVMIPNTEVTDKEFNDHVEKFSRLPTKLPGLHIK